MIYYAVKIVGLPKMFIAASSEAEVMVKLRAMLKRPTDDIESVERVTAADVRNHFRDMVSSGASPQTEETYSPQKHEWGTTAATEYAKELTPGEKRNKKKMKDFHNFRESVNSADKKPQNYVDPITGKTKTRMVPVDKGIVKNENYGVSDPTDTGGAEEVSMAKRQLAFIKYACDEIAEYLEMAGDMEEWFQNKMATAHNKIKTLHAYIEGEKRVRGMEDEEDEEEMGESHIPYYGEEELDEASLRKSIATNSSKFPEGSHVYHPKTDKLGKVMSVGKDFVKVAHAKGAGRNGQVRYQMKDYHPSELKRIKTRTTPKKYKIGGREGEIV